MDKIILVEINVGNYFRDRKVKAVQEKINEYIRNNHLDVLSVSLFKNDDDNYVFTITTR